MKSIQATGFVIQPRLQFKSIREQMVYQYLFSKANFKDHKSLEIGQTIIVLSDLEKATGWTRRMLRITLEKLEDDKLITFETLPQKRGILVTVSEYESFQKLENYKKNKQKNVHENEQQDVNENGQENVHEDNEGKPCGSRGEDMTKNNNVHENEQQNAQEDVHENEQLISITAFINSIKNINKTLKYYLESAKVAKVKSMNLTSTDEIESFVDFALRTNALDAGVSKKILIAYFDTIRLTRQTCTISANILANLIDKMSKYSVDQLHYAMWKHCEQHEDKREQYTLGILRNTDVHQAKRGLMKLKNKGGSDYAQPSPYLAAVGETTSSTSAETQRLEELARKRGLAGGTVRDIDVDF